MKGVLSVMIDFTVNPNCLIRVDIHICPFSDEIEAMKIVKYLKLNKVKIRGLGSSSGLVQ